MKSGAAPRGRRRGHGDPDNLAFTRASDVTSAKEVVIDVGDRNKIEKALPLNERGEVAATFAKAVRFAMAARWTW